MAPGNEAGPADGPGLRERKKRQTRLALSQAAVRLCVLEGWDSATVERIAAEAEVSVRTFRNYFGSKAEAIAASHLERMLCIAEDLAGRPADEPLWDALLHAALGQFAPPGSDSTASQQTRWREGVRLMLAEPALAGEMVKANAAATHELTRAVAHRTGTNADDLYPKLVAGAVGAATAVAIEHSLRADPSTSLGAILTQAFEQVAAGLPVP